MKKPLHTISSLLTILFWMALFFPSPTTAQETLQTNPKERPVTVSASVPDSQAPSTPILISPENQSLLTTSTPSFVWSLTEDNVGVTSYTLFLDGQIWFDDIPTTSVTTSDYTLTYNSGTQTYSLTPKSGVGDGTHTWKIRAQDARDNATSSVTWSFAIDTRAPTFVTTQVDTTNTNISSQDVSTVPTEPIFVTNNQPILKGTGEGNSTVKLVIQAKDGSFTQTYTFTIGSDGTWEVQLGILPKDVTIYLDFTITDQSGNISLVKDVPLILVTVKLLLPPENPLIEIPLTSPRELAQELYYQTRPLMPFPIHNALEYALRTPLPVTSRLFWVVPLLFLSLSLLRVGLIVAPYLSLLTPRLLAQALWLALLPLFRGPRGFVFDVVSKKGAAFGLLHIVQHREQHTEHLSSLLTDKNGFYYSLRVEEGTFSFEVAPPFGFPPVQPRPTETAVADYYLGERIACTEEIPSLRIPVDVPSRVSGRQRLRTLLLTMTDLYGGLAIIWLVASGVLTALYPSVWNVGALIIYVVLIGIKVVRKAQLNRA